MHRKDRKFADKYHAMADEIRALEAKLAQADADKERAVEVAVSKAKADLQADIEEIDRQLRAEIRQHTGHLSEHAYNLQTAATPIERLKHTVEATKLRETDLKAQLEVMTASRDSWRSKAEATQPAIDAARRDVAELRSLLDRVRDRMRRREIDRVEAIVNRKVLAGAIPGRR